MNQEMLDKLAAIKAKQASQKIDNLELPIDKPIKIALEEAIPEQFDSIPLIDEPEEIVKPSKRPIPNVSIDIPLTPLEKDIEADREVGRKAISSLDGEAIYTENEYLADQFKDEDKKEQFKKIFTQTIQQNCLGMSLDEVDEMLRERHEMLFDVRSGIQGLLAFRKELLKDVTAEERSKRLKNDYLHTPSARAVKDGRSKDKKEKTQKVKEDKKPKMSTFETLVSGLVQLKGLTLDEAKAKVTAMTGMTK